MRISSVSFTSVGSAHYQKNGPDGTKDSLDVLSRGRGVAALLAEKVAVFLCQCCEIGDGDLLGTHAAMYFISRLWNFGRR